MVSLAWEVVIPGAAGDLQFAGATARLQIYLRAMLRMTYIQA